MLLITLCQQRTAPTLKGCLKTWQIEFTKVEKANSRLTRAEEETPDLNCRKSPGNKCRHKKKVVADFCFEFFFTL